MSVRPVLAALLVAAACQPAPAQPAASPPAQAVTPSVETPIPIGSHAVVRPSAVIWLDAKAERPLDLPELLPGRGLAVRIVAEHGDRLEVETDTTSPCASLPLRNFRLRLFVARTDLADVTTTRVVHPLVSGGEIHVAAGAPVEGSADARWVPAVNGGATLRVPIPAASVGRFFPAPSPSADALCVAQVQPGNEDRPADDDASLAAMLAQEAGFTGRASEVASGAQIYWRDGSPAGSVARPHTFARDVVVAGARSCFAMPIAVGDEVMLCFAASDVKAAELGGTIGLGNTGIIAGREFGGRGKRVPQVRQAKADVKGALDKDIVRRIVRAHINEMRHCYNKALVKTPDLAGRVVVRFVVDAAGNVTESASPESSVADADVVACMVAAVGRWKFPKPEGGGTVTVHYPFILEPG